MKTLINASGENCAKIYVVSLAGNFRSRKTPVLEEVVPWRMVFIERPGAEFL